MASGGQTYNVQFGFYNEVSNHLPKPISPFSQNPPNFFWMTKVFGKPLTPISQSPILLAKNPPLAKNPHFSQYPTLAETLPLTKPPQKMLVKKSFIKKIVGPKKMLVKKMCASKKFVSKICWFKENWTGTFFG